MFDSSKIRIVEDFPKKGISFFDITTVLNDAEAFQKLFDALLEKATKLQPDVIVGLEARGYFFAPMLALALKLPFVPIRKKGKLPFHTFAASYDLEYGSETIEIHTDAIQQNKNVLIFDDILATGGTAQAAANLVQHFAPNKIEFLFLMELSFLNGKTKITDYHHDSLIIE